MSLRKKFFVAAFLAVVFGGGALTAYGYHKKRVAITLAVLCLVPAVIAARAGTRRWEP